MMTPSLGDLLLILMAAPASGIKVVVVARTSNSKVDLILLHSYIIQSQQLGRIS